jgi:hypothetical protein
LIIGRPLYRKRFGAWPPARCSHQAEGRAEALLAVLEARGLPASAETRARILACTDDAQLDAWIRKAVGITSVDELF